MKRAILTPAIPPPSALAELKDWLGIATPRDDDGLNTLLRTALDTCEAFTGVVPIAVPCEEILPGAARWQALSTVPVLAITAVSTLSATGVRSTLMPGAFDIDLDENGAGRVRLSSSAAATRVVVSFTAGLAPDWMSLPTALRHGIMRLAAHGYRQREGDEGAEPPAAVAALWRPWRRLRLA